LKLDKIYIELTKRFKPENLRKVIVGSIWLIILITSMLMVGSVTFYMVSIGLAAMAVIIFMLGFVEKRSDKKYEINKKQVSEILYQVKKLKLRIQQQ